MEWHPTFAVPLGTGNFYTIQSAGTHDLDPLGTQPHGVLHRTFHGAAEHDPLFQLLCNVVGDQLGINFRFADFFDIHMHRNTHQLLQCPAQNLDIFAFFTDHNTGT